MLLAQIGKEGWDCRSLTGVILPHQGACPNNMVLQTSCRCLRQTKRGATESALIWLNRFNADKLNRQLKLLQDTSLEEFSHAGPVGLKTVERYNRTAVEKVPAIDFYQLRVVYEEYTEKEAAPADLLAPELVVQKRTETVVASQNFEGKSLGLRKDEDQSLGEALSFFGWLTRIAKESMGHLTVQQLLAEKTKLQIVYTKVSEDVDGVRRLTPAVDQEAVRSNIRRAFYPRRNFTVKESWELCRAELVDAHRWKSTISVENFDNILPDAATVEEIRCWDEGRQAEQIAPDFRNFIETFIQSQNLSGDQAQAMRAQMLAQAGASKTDPHPERHQTYHYAPYRFDSNMEQEFLKNTLPLLRDRYPDVKIYFNGDDTITGFRIRCYKKTESGWKNIGVYVPDFVLLRKNPDGLIERVLIVETKGAHLKEHFEDRRKFMKTVFSPGNNKKFS